MKKKKFILVIPARYGSSRLKGKPLKKILGLPMIIRTALQCQKSVKKENIYIATDNLKIMNVCRVHGFKSILIKGKILTGTDRVAEVAKKIKADYYLNVQGDEPLFNPSDITKLVNNIKKNHKNVLLGFTEIKNKKDIKSPHVPKVCFNKNKELFYASRSAIPLNFSNNKTKYYRQVLAYSFPRNELMQFAKLKKKTPLEEYEDIEILRFLEIGVKVQLIEMSKKSHPVDTKEDLKKIIKLLKK